MPDIKTMKRNKTILSAFWGGLIVTIIGFLFILNQMNKQVANHTYTSPYASDIKETTPLSQAVPKTKQESQTETVAVMPSEELVAFTDEENILLGKTIYDKNCLACHGPDGGGTVGPNLTDEYWVHGGSTQDIVTIINEGNIAKGMIPWKTTLNSNEVLQVTSFILSLQGSNPANGKAPEGE
jgi:cytochrome c oxidase cbb3-type subunit 3